MVKDYHIYYDTLTVRVPGTPVYKYLGLPEKGHNWDILHVKGLDKKSF
jgi:hypothetical protein